MRLATHSVGMCKQAQIICSHQSQVKCWRNVKKVTHCLRCFCGSESSGMATKVFLPLDAAHVRKHTRLQSFTFSGAGETGNEAIISHPTRNTCTIVEGVQGA